MDLNFSHLNGEGKFAILDKAPADDGCVLVMGRTVGRNHRESPWPNMKWIIWHVERDGTTENTFIYATFDEAMDHMELGSAPRDAA